MPMTIVQRIPDGRLGEHLRPARKKPCERLSRRPLRH